MSTPRRYRDRALQRRAAGSRAILAGVALIVAGAAGGGATHCGGTNILADDCSGADAGEVWVRTASGGAAVAEAGGEAVVTLPDGAATGSRGSFQTERYYDLRGDTISVEVTSAASTA